MTRSRRVLSGRPKGGRTLAAAATLAGLVALGFADVLFAGRTLSAAAYVPGVLPSGPVELANHPVPPRHLRDPEGAAWVNEPSPYLVHRALARGKLPLWNPREGLGAPLAANPNAGVWSPLALAVNLWPSPLVQDLSWLGRVWLLGCFTALLARALGLGWSAALGSAIALMLSGQTVEWIAHHPLNTDVFVPLALLGALHTLHGRRSGPPMLALAVAAGLLGGKPQSAVVAALFCAPWLLAAAPRAARQVGVLLAASLLGLALAAIAVLPFVETYLDASGLVRAGRSTQGASALPPSGIAGLIGPWAERWLAQATGSSSDGAWVAPALPHAGLIALALAAVGLWRTRRHPLAWILAATIVVYLLGIFSVRAGGLGTLPVLRSISFVKYCFPLYLAIALLAGFGIATARRRILLLLALCAELLWLVPRPHPARVEPFAPAPYLTALERLGALEGSRNGAGGPLAAGRIAGPFDLLPPLVSNAVGFADLRAIDVLTPASTWNFVTQLISPSRGLSWILSDLDPLLVATAPASDLADVRWVLSRAPLDPTRLPEAVRAHVSARRLTRLFDSLRRYSIDTSWLWAGVDSLASDLRFHWTCATPCRMRFDLAALPERFASGFATPDSSRIEVRLRAQSHSGESRERWRSLEGPSHAWEDLWLDIKAVAGEEGTVLIEVSSPESAIAWIGGVGPSPGPGAEARAATRELAAREREMARLALRYADETAHIYENTDAFGPAWIASEVRRVSDADAAWRALATSDRPLAVIDESALGGRPWPESSDGVARLRRATPRALDVAVEVSTGGVLVVPVDGAGWTAWVDGAETARLRVNGALTGIVVPAGAREVRLVYAPPTLLLGALLSAAALLTLLLWVLRMPYDPRS